MWGEMTASTDLGKRTACHIPKAIKATRHQRTGEFLGANRHSRSTRAAQSKSPMLRVEVIAKNEKDSAPPKSHGEMAMRSRMSSSMSRGSQRSTKANIQYRFALKVVNLFSAEPAKES